MTTCPVCSPATPGYTTTPATPALPNGRVTRCEVCKGHGHVTLAQLTGWEMSL